MSMHMTTPAGSVSANTLPELMEQWAALKGLTKAEDQRTPEWQELESSYIQHLKWRFHYPQQVFTQQIIATWVITIVVLALVVCGLVFSFLQLHNAISLGNPAALGRVRKLVEIVSGASPVNGSS